MGPSQSTRAPVDVGRLCFDDEPTARARCGSRRRVDAAVCRGVDGAASDCQAHAGVDRWCVAMVPHPVISPHRLSSLRCAGHHLELIATFDASCVASDNGATGYGLAVLNSTSVSWNGTYLVVNGPRVSNGVDGGHYSPSVSLSHSHSHSHSGSLWLWLWLWLRCERRALLATRAAPRRGAVPPCLHRRRRYRSDSEQSDARHSRRPATKRCICARRDSWLRIATAALRGLRTQGPRATTAARYVAMIGYCR